MPPDPLESALYAARDDKINVQPDHFKFGGYGPVQSHKLLVRGERISAIACMSVNGMLDCKTVKQTVNGDVFYDFVYKLHCYLT